MSKFQKGFRKYPGGRIFPAKAGGYCWQGFATVNGYSPGPLRAGVEDSRTVSLAKDTGLYKVPSLMESKAANVSPVVDVLMGLAGAAAGGGAGYFVFGWLTAQGFYAVALPGVLLGLGAGMLRQRQSLAFSIGCGVAALGLSIFAEWKHFPFIADDSLGYFLRHLLDLKPVTLIMIALGGFAGFWFSRRPTRRTANVSQSRPAP